MLMRFIILIGLTLSQASHGSILNFPPEMIIMTCTNVSSGKVVIEVYKVGSEHLVAFFDKNGIPGGISAIPNDSSFSSKNGASQNLNLVKVEDKKYSFSVYFANLDGSNGQSIVEPTDVSCNANST